MASQWRTDLRLFLTIIGELMITAGVLVFLFAGWQLWWTDLESERSSANVRQELTKQWDKEKVPVATKPDLPKNVPPNDVIIKNPTPHEPFALLHIPEFSDTWKDKPRPIVNGVADDDLQAAVGYYSETVGPGGVGNFSIAGHRVTWGRPFHNIERMQPGDPVVIETEKAWFVYKMTNYQIVKPSDIAVIAPVPNQPGTPPTERLLTMTACHPKFSARERYIVHAKLDYWQPRSAGEPKELTDPAFQAPKE